MQAGYAKPQNTCIPRVEPLRPDINRKSPMRDIQSISSRPARRGTVPAAAVPSLAILRMAVPVSNGVAA